MSEKNALDLLNKKMENMSKDELRGMVLIATNRVGVMLNGGHDYPSTEEGIKMLVEGAEIVLAAYENAIMMQESMRVDN